jgi:CheY-like chemotaxis protein
MCHVLVIEDDCIIVMDIADIAIGAGASSIEIASRKSEAIKAADHRRPATILSDVQLLEVTGPLAVVAI